MFRSLHMKLVLIMLLLITSLMTVVGTFMMTNITGFYIDEFYNQVDAVFGSSNPANAAFVNTLRKEAAQADGQVTIRQMIEAKAGDLGLNSSTRNFYLLDGRAGAGKGISPQTIWTPLSPSPAGKTPTLSISMITGAP